MLIDVRTYKCKPNTLKKHLELYEKYGKKPQVKTLDIRYYFSLRLVIPMNIFMFGL